MPRKETPALEDFLHDVANLKEAADLLEKVYSTLGGAYGTADALQAAAKRDGFPAQDEVQETIHRIRRYFSFDDSE